MGEAFREVSHNRSSGGRGLPRSISQPFERWGRPSAKYPTTVRAVGEAFREVSHNRSSGGEAFREVSHNRSS